MIELTEEQRRALAERPESPLRLIDPETKQEFVLASARWFEKNAQGGLDEEAARFGVYPPLFRAMKAYWRDLPGLLRGWWKRGKWVAYYGDTRIGTARSQRRLLRMSHQRGIPLNEVYIALIEDRPQPPWEPESIDGGLYEFDDEDVPPPGQS